MIEAIARFNNGNGGVSILIERENNKGDTFVTGQLVSPEEAVRVGLEILDKAFNSRNASLPAEIVDAVNKAFKAL